MFQRSCTRSSPYNRFIQLQNNRNAVWKQFLGGRSKRIAENKESQDYNRDKKHVGSRHSIRTRILWWQVPKKENNTLKDPNYLYKKYTTKKHYAATWQQRALYKKSWQPHQQVPTQDSSSTTIALRQRLRPSDTMESRQLTTAAILIIKLAVFVVDWSWRSSWEECR